MSEERKSGKAVNAKLLNGYFAVLVNQFFKILPMREEEAKTLPKYIWRLQAELIGISRLVAHAAEDPYYGSLLGIAQYLSDNAMTCSVEQVRQLVFEAMGVCKKLSARYESGDEA